MKPHPPGAVASLACGVLALMVVLVPGLGLLLGIAALVNARRAEQALVAKPDAYLASGLSTAGVVCGVIGGIFSLIVTLWMMAMMSLVGVLMHAIPAMPVVIPHVPML